MNKEKMDTQKLSNLLQISLLISPGAQNSNSELHESKGDYCSSHYFFSSHQESILSHCSTHFLRTHEFYKINEAEIDDAGKVYRWSIMDILCISEYKLTYRVGVSLIKNQIVFYCKVPDNKRNK